MTAVQLLVAVLLIAGNALFVGAEFSAISVRRAQLEPLAETSVAAQRVLVHLRSLSMLLAGAQLGITLCSLGLGAVAEPAVAHVLENVLHLVHVPDTLLHPISFAVALTLVVFLHMVLGEMVPKNLSLAGPERAALVLIPALAAFVRVTRPLILLLNGLANRGLRLLNVEPKDELDASHTSEELAEIIAESRSEGLLDEEKHERLTGALALENLHARDVMIPVDRLVTVSPSITAGQLEDLVAETGYSRFPVASAMPDSGTTEAGGSRPGRRLAPVRARPVRGRRGAVTAATVVGDGPPPVPPPGGTELPPDGAWTSVPTTTEEAVELLGFVHAKDVLGLSAAARRQPLPLQRLRTMPALSPDQPLSEVLTELQRIGSHLGQVQQGGRTLGILALEDVVEAFVGEVEDASHLDAESDPQPGHEYAPTSPVRHLEPAGPGGTAGAREEASAVDRIQEGSD
jgi:CBS domain containing-hemolysin-like protein